MAIPTPMRIGFVGLRVMGKSIARNPIPNLGDVPKGLGVAEQ
jgi:hypothetical protein